MQRILGILVFIVVVFGFAMSSARADLPESNVATFDVDGLTLSMPIDVFRKRYPDAEFTEMTAARYCHGEEVRIDALSRLGAVVQQGDATVHISFDYKFFGQGITTIKRDEVIEFDSSRFTSLRDGLVRQYGPFTRLKYPSKMDPAGLFVGFEWEKRGVAYLSVTIHRDHTDEFGAILQTTFLTRSLPGMNNQSIAAAYYRDEVQTFREKCASR